MVEMAAERTSLELVDELFAGTDQPGSGDAIHPG